MSNVFSRTGSLSPQRSIFDLSYTKLLDADMGLLYPIMCDEVIPGDKFKIGNEIVIRLNPLVAPILHEINCYVHYFFVPYRLLWKDWEKFITGGEDGDFVATPPVYTPTTSDLRGTTLWDYFGFPTFGGTATTAAMSPPYPSDFPRRAYNFIWNEYYRDENLQDPIGGDSYPDDPDSLANNFLLLRRDWEKDYFTSSLPFQQRGTAPALPISGLTNADFTSLDITNTGSASQPAALLGLNNDFNLKLGNSNTSAATDSFKNTLTAGNVVDLGSATTFNISDLRVAFQIQKWLERNARGGARYTEFLRSHFSVCPRDDRLQRPEYIGGSKSPVIISEVLQTSATQQTSGTGDPVVSPQGNLAGHGITVDRNFCASYFAQEFGLIMGIMSIMPRSAYNAQGIDRQWLRETKFDFPFPEFVNLSEQAIINSEIVATGDQSHNRTLFGFQGRFDELRVKRSLVVGQLRDTLNYWHISRIFDNQPNTAPRLNESFIQCNPRKDIFAVPSEPGFIVHVGNKIMAVRPIPVQSEPGLIDHH